MTKWAFTPDLLNESGKLQFKNLYTIHLEICISKPPG